MLRFATLCYVLQPYIRSAILLYVLQFNNVLRPYVTIRDFTLCCIVLRYVVRTYVTFWDLALHSKGVSFSCYVALDLEIRLCLTKCPTWWQLCWTIIILAPDNVRVRRLFSGLPSPVICYLDLVTTNHWSNVETGTSSEACNEVYSQLPFSYHG